MKAVVASQELLVLFVRTELDGSIWDHPDHRGRVPTPQAQEAVIEVGAIDQPIGFLHATENENGVEGERRRRFPLFT